MRPPLLMGMALLAFAVAAWAAEADKDADATIEVTGTLKTGVVAVGGETTGTTLTARDRTYELDWTSKELREQGNKLNGKPVKVTGKLIVKRGVEVGERRIIHVTKLEPVK